MRPASPSRPALPEAHRPRFNPESLFVLAALGLRHSAAAAQLRHYARQPWPDFAREAAAAVALYPEPCDALAAWGPAWREQWPPADARLAPWSDQAGAVNLAHVAPIPSWAQLVIRAKQDLDPRARFILAAGWQAELRQALRRAGRFELERPDLFAHVAEKPEVAALLERLVDLAQQLYTDPKPWRAELAALLDPNAFGPVAGPAVDHQERLRGKLARIVNRLSRSLFRVRRIETLPEIRAASSGADAEIAEAERFLNPRFEIDSDGLEHVLISALANHYAHAFEEREGVWRDLWYGPRDSVRRSGAAWYRIAADLHRRLGTLGAAKAVSEARGGPRDRVARTLEQSMEAALAGFFQSYEQAPWVSKAHVQEWLRHELGVKKIPGKAFARCWEKIVPPDHLWRRSGKRPAPPRAIAPNVLGGELTGDG